MTDPIVTQIYEAVEQLTPDQRIQLFTLLGSRIGVPRTMGDVLSDLAAMKTLHTQAAPLSGRYAGMGRDSAQDDTIAIIRELRGNLTTNGQKPST
jgi:hypothetical protein